MFFIDSQDLLSCHLLYLHIDLQSVNVDFADQWIEVSLIELVIHPLI